MKKRTTRKAASKVPAKSRAVTARKASKKSVRKRGSKNENSVSFSAVIAKMDKVLEELAGVISRTDSPAAKAIHAAIENARNSINCQTTMTINFGD